MEPFRQLLQELGMTKKLYLRICLILLLAVLLQWPNPVAGEPVDHAYAYQYGLFNPWLHIYKTENLGRLHLLQALTAGHSLGDGPVHSINGFVFWDAFQIFVCIGIYRYFVFQYRKKPNLLPQSPLRPRRIRPERKNG